MEMAKSERGLNFRPGMGMNPRRIFRDFFMA